MKQNFEDDLKVIMKLVDKAVMIPSFTYAMHENAPRPKDKYACVRLVKSKTPSTDVTYDEYINNQLFQVVEGIRVLTFEVLFSHDEEESAWFEGCFGRQDIIQYMKDAGYGVLEHGNLEEHDLTRETTWEVRTGYRLDVSVVRRFYMHPDMEQFGKGTHHQAILASGGTDNIEAALIDYLYEDESGTIVVDKDGITEEPSINP